MKKFRIGLIIVAIIIISGEFIIMDYSNLFSGKNLGSALVMLSAVFVIISMILSIKKDREKIENPDNQLGGK
jgi:hypothetical protein